MVQQTRTYSLVDFHRDEEGYLPRFPALPGCHTQGETLEDAEKNIKEALSLYLESLEEHNQSFPKELRILQGRVEIKLA